MKLPAKKRDYNYLISNIGNILEEGRKQTVRTVNKILVQTYWEIGREIVEYEQKGKIRARYGTKLIKKLSKDLKLRYGKGFARNNLQYMRQFYIKYPKCRTLSGKSNDQKHQTLSGKSAKSETMSNQSRKSQTLSDQLSWSHYIELLMIDEELERSFYEKQCIKGGWSVRELKRQKNSALFHRIALSKDKKGVMKLSKKGHTPEKPKDLVMDPYILEFLNIPEDYRYSEKELEQKIISNLQMFLLEFGKGLTFVARQFRITLSNKHFYVDLVFYHRILRCFVLVDLKIGEVRHSDVGQMNLYLNYFKAEENSKGDNEPIGIILGSEKDNVTIKYALGGLTNKLFVSKYKLYLPDKKELENRLKKIIKNST